MAKRGKRRSSKGNNSCCPVITVKCGRKGRGRGGLGDATPGFLRTAEQVLTDKRSAQAVAHKKGLKVFCTVKVGAKSHRVHISRLRAKISGLIRGQHKRRCIPKLNGKLIIGQRASKF